MSRLFVNNVFAVRKAKDSTMPLDLKTNFKVLNKQSLSPDVRRLDVFAPEIARRIEPGQFVVVIPQERSERIPLCVVDSDSMKGSISLVFQEIGFSTRQLGALQINDVIFDILGPLGFPSRIEKTGNVVCISTGIGITQMLPICRAHKKAGSKVIGIMGAKTKRELMLEAQLRLTCQKILIATNDGSYIRRALATDLLKEILKKETVDLVYATGSVDMMEAVCAITQEKNIPTRVSLRPLILDATGLCGSCRVKVGGRTVLACVEGTEFDGHAVDFKDLKIRMNAIEVKKDAQGNEIPWFHPKSQPSRQISASEILTKFRRVFQKNTR